MAWHVARAYEPTLPGQAPGKSRLPPRVGRWPLLGDDRIEVGSAGSEARLQSDVAGVLDQDRSADGHHQGDDQTDRSESARCGHRLGSEHDQQPGEHQDRQHHPGRQRPARKGLGPQQQGRGRHGESHHTRGAEALALDGRGPTLRRRCHSRSIESSGSILGSTHAPMRSRYGVVRLLSDIFQRDKARRRGYVGTLHHSHPTSGQRSGRRGARYEKAVRSLRRRLDTVRGHDLVPYLLLDGTRTRRCSSVSGDLHTDAMSLPPLKALPAHDRPRERLLREGAAALSDAELVAVLLGTGGRGCNAVALAQDLLARCGGVAGMARWGVPELSRLDAMGSAKASRLIAAFALAGRRQSFDEHPRLINSGAIATLARARLGGARVERLLVLVADSGLRFRHAEEVSLGAASTCAVPVREVLSAVLRHDGVAFALAHNHPGGDPTPTGADREATERVADAAAQVGLRFLDHVVVTDTDWRSVSASR